MTCYLLCIAGQCCKFWKVYTFIENCHCISAVGCHSTQVLLNRVYNKSLQHIGLVPLLKLTKPLKNSLIYKHTHRAQTKYAQRIMCKATFREIHGIWTLIRQEGVFLSVRCPDFFTRKSVIQVSCQLLQLQRILTCLCVCWCRP